MGLSENLVNQIHSIYGNKIYEKYDATVEHIHQFVHYYYDKDQEKYNIVICADIIYDVILNYFVDIQRFKERHDMNHESDRTSAGKIAAFTAKWLIKFRPIMASPINSQMLSEKSRFFARNINELFAIEHVEAIIRRKLKPKLVRELISDFRQKKMSESQLYMILEHCMGFYDK